MFSYLSLINIISEKYFQILLKLSEVFNFEIEPFWIVLIPNNHIINCVFNRRIRGREHVCFIY